VATLEGAGMSKSTPSKTTALLNGVLHQVRRSGGVMFMWSGPVVQGPLTWSKVSSDRQMGFQGDEGERPAESLSYEWMLWHRILKGGWRPWQKKGA
jgi:hypothetical protein